MIHKVATFPCPKFKNLSFLEVAEKQEVHAQLHILFVILKNVVMLRVHLTPLV